MRTLDKQYTSILSVEITELSRLKLKKKTWNLILVKQFFTHGRRQLTRDFVYFFLGNHTWLYFTKNSGNSIFERFSDAE